MKSVSRAVLAGCGWLIAVGSASSQMPQMSDQARQLAIKPHVTTITPAARANLATQLAGEPISATAISGTVAVSVRSPLVGEPAAPTLALDGFGGNWIASGTDPRAELTSDLSSVRLTMQLDAGARHLVVCEMGPRSMVTVRTAVGTAPLSIAWESNTRGAILIPMYASARGMALHLYGSRGVNGARGTVRSCEVSRIG